MKKINFIIAGMISVITVIIFTQSCSSSKEIVASKTGVQLWGENCIRSHNAPSPVDFTDSQWKTIGLHMQDRANLTKEEAEKIFSFLKSAN